MDFKFTPEQEKLREEVKTFLNKELPTNWIEYIGTTIDDSIVHTENGLKVFKDIARKMGQKGWLSMTWPEKYGGQNRPNVDYLVFLEEIAKRGSPGFNAVGPKMLAPTLIIYGTEEQKERFLRPMITADELWCESFSEPEAGSDLAALQTKAIKDGDYYILNGQKTWSTFAPYSNWSCLIARTDPYSTRHRGLSFFLVDLNSLGITNKPIENIAGEPHFGEIFFEDVRVPKENLLGNENEGWKVAQTFLSFERVYIAPISVIKTMIDMLVQYSKENPVLNYENFRNTLLNIAFEAEVGRMLCYQVAWLQDRKLATEWHAAMTRMYSTRLLKRAASECLQLLGLYGQLDLHDNRAPLKGWLEHLYLSALGATIAAGTTEIQKLIIATRGLGMPTA